MATFSLTFAEGTPILSSQKSKLLSNNIEVTGRQEEVSVKISEAK